MIRISTDRTLNRVCLTIIVRWCEHKKPVFSQHHRRNSSAPSIPIKLITLKNPKKLKLLNLKVVLILHNWCKSSYPSQKVKPTWQPFRKNEDWRRRPVWMSCPNLEVGLWPIQASDFSNKLNQCANIRKKIQQNKLRQNNNSRQCPAYNP